MKKTLFKIEEGARNVKRHMLYLDVEMILLERGAALS
jgi:hypothetical protein